MWCTMATVTGHVAVGCVDNCLSLLFISLSLRPFVWAKKGECNVPNLEPNHSNTFFQFSYSFNLDTKKCQTSTINTVSASDIFRPHTQCSWLSITQSLLTRRHLSQSLVLAGMMLPITILSLSPPPPLNLKGITRHKITIATVTRFCHPFLRLKFNTITWILPDLRNWTPCQASIPGVPFMSTGPSVAGASFSLPSSPSLSIVAGSVCTASPLLGAASFTPASLACSCFSLNCSHRGVSWSTWQRRSTLPVEHT